MMSRTVEHIANLANLLDDALQEKLWEYAELLYVEQVAFESDDPGCWAREPCKDADAFLSIENARRS